MATIKDVRTLDGQIVDFTIPSDKDQIIDAKKQLVLIPGVIDPHFSFDLSNHENAAFTIQNAIRGGITTAVVIPGPNNPCNSVESYGNATKTINKELSKLDIPLNTAFYAKGNLEQIEELGKIKKQIKGIVIALDASKKEELNDDWERLFQIAAWENLPIVINADEKNTNIEKAIYYAERQSTRLYILNVSTRSELDLIHEGRKRALLIYAETTPQHLFSEDKVQSDMLWEALNSGVIETIGSGYHPDRPGKSRLLFRNGNFSFSDPIFLLPLLLTASRQGKIAIEKVIRLLKVNVLDILTLPPSNDYVLVDLDHEQEVQKVTEGRSVDFKLKGWPVYTIVNGHVIPTAFSGYQIKPQ